MKLYFLERLDEVYPYQYDSAIVAAESANDAEHIHPNKKITGGPEMWNQGPYSSWTSPIFLFSREIGLARTGIERGVILASFRTK